MIWLTWRQFRAQTLVAAAMLVVVAIALGVTGPQLAHLYATSGISSCRANGNCGVLASDFLRKLKFDDAYSLPYYVGLALTLVVPAIIGVAAMATAGLLSLMVTWWASPLGRVASLAGTGSGGMVDPADRFEPLIFAAHGIVPVGYALFAFVLGVTVGVMVRRTLPAMAVTLAVFIALQVLMPAGIRPHLVTPVRTDTALQASAINGLDMDPGGQTTVFTSITTHPGAWLLSSQVVRANGQPFTGPAPRACSSSSFQNCQNALGRLHLRQLISYQPASRYWLFQWLETLIFVAFSVALAGFCFWRVRRRILS
jgi:hypothetical protein